MWRGDAGGEGWGEVERSGQGADCDAAIKVSIEGGRVVVRPVGQLDGDSIDALCALVGCAREAGVMAVVDLDGVELGELAGHGPLARLVTASGSDTSSLSA
jgi:hypothetical protein